MNKLKKTYKHEEKIKSFLEPLFLNSNHIEINKTKLFLNLRKLGFRFKNENIKSVNNKVGLYYNCFYLKKSKNFKFEKFDNIINCNYLNKKVNLNKQDVIKTYLMKDICSGFYKIGKSNQPKTRERTLQSENPLIKMVKVWDYNIESELHFLFNKQRIRGEWFNLSKIQVKYICTHK